MAAAKRKIRARTARERKTRKRTLEVLDSLRKARNTTKTRQRAMGLVLEGSKAAQGIKGKPLLELPEADALKLIDKKVIPSESERQRIASALALRKKRGERVSTRKRNVIKRIFSSGEFGLIMVKPELVSDTRAVSKFLKESGFDVLLSKLFVFGREDIARLYPHTLKNRAKYASFGVQIFSLLSTPSRVFVFRHQPIEAYQKFANRHRLGVIIPKSTKPQDAFAMVFKEYLRKRFTAAKLKPKGFEKGRLSRNARAVDAFGFFEGSAANRTNPMVVVNGVHVPLTLELPRDARTLLSLSELIKLDKRRKDK